LEGDPAKPLGRVRSAVRAGWRAWASHFWTTTALLGALTALWQLPQELVRRRTPQGLSIGLEIVIGAAQAVWWAPVLAGQIAFSLWLFRGHGASVRVFLAGARRSAAMAAYWVILNTAAAVAGRLPQSSGEDLGWRDGLFVVVALVGLYFFLRTAYAPAVLVDLRMGPLAAIRQSWGLTRGRVWPLALLAALSFVAWIILFVIGARSFAVAGSLLSLCFGPLLSLSYINLYFDSQGRVAIPGPENSTR